MGSTSLNFTPNNPPTTHLSTLLYKQQQQHPVLLVHIKSSSFSDCNDFSAAEFNPAEQKVEKEDEEEVEEVEEEEED